LDAIGGAALIDGVWQAARLSRCSAVDAWRIQTALGNVVGQPFLYACAVSPPVLYRALSVYWV